MRRHGDAGTLLRRLLERHEGRTTNHRLIERPSQTFATLDDRKAMIDVLTAAAASGAVDLVWDRDAPHLLSQVILRDAERLHRFTGRVPRTEEVKTAVAALDAFDGVTEIARKLVSDLATAWQAGKRLAGLGPEDAGQAVALLRATEAAFTSLPASVPLRTRSARLLGDSKALERSLSPLLFYLRTTGAIEPDLPRDEALKRLGLSKFPQPVLAAGALSLHGLHVDDWPYIGIPPELLDGVEVGSATRSLLTIENLESFNRHVREARQKGDVVVYTGGFPAPTVVSLLVRLAEAARLDRIHHWGDVDPGGLRIALFLESTLPVPIEPHLMDQQLALRHGSVPSSRQQVPLPSRESAFAPLAAYLHHNDASWLEQEAIDPQPVPQFGPS